MFVEINLAWEQGCNRCLRLWNETDRNRTTMSLNATQDARQGVWLKRSQFKQVWTALSSRWTYSDAVHTHLAGVASRPIYCGGTNSCLWSKNGDDESPRPLVLSWRSPWGPWRTTVFTDQQSITLTRAWNRELMWMIVAGLARGKNKALSPHDLKSAAHLCPSQMTEYSCLLFLLYLQHYVLIGAPLLNTFYADWM